MSTKIIYVEDQPDLGFLTMQYLDKRGFDVIWCKTGKSALDTYRLHAHEEVLLIIDVQLPDMDGFDLARRIIMHNSKIWIFFLTARTEKTDRMLGLDIGAIDYICKPFEIDELVLRIRNLTDRLKKEASGKLTDSTIRIGDILFDNKALCLVIDGHLRISLTIREAELLEYLFKTRNTVVRKEDLLLRFWGQNDYFLGRSLDVFISRLRKFLRKSATGMTIDNVYGVGFMLSIPDTDEEPIC